MWTYFIGPFLALLPKPWRDALSFRYANIARAAVLSSLAETAGALLALGYWYNYAMNTWISRGLDNAMAGRLGVVTDQQIASVALSIWFTHPFTWFLAFFVVEGAVRLCGAAFSEEVLGSLPLFLVDKIVFNPFRGSRCPSLANGNPVAASASFSGAIRERVMTARLPEVADELTVRTSGPDEFLDISASRRKGDWIPPRTVRCGETYYRLESCTVDSGPRPFRYTLRRLSAGVPGRSVLLYTPPRH